MTAAVTVLGLAVALLTVLVVGLLRSHAEVLRRLHELGADVYDEADHGPGDGRFRTAGTIETVEGVAAPGDLAGTAPARDIDGVTPAGDAVALGIVGARHLTLLAFLSSGCATCGAFWRAFTAGVAADLPPVAGGTRLVIVTRGPERESPTELRRLAPPDTATVMSSAAYEDYGVPVSPYFVLVDGRRGRVIGEGAAATWPQVANLLRQAVGDRDEDQAHPARPARTGGGSRARDERAEADLASAGIGPGHPSLYPGRTADGVAAEPRGEG